MKLMLKGDGGKALACNIKKIQVASLDNKLKQKMEERNRAQLHESSLHCRKNGNDSVRKKGTGQLFTNEYNDIFDFDQDSLQITLIQGQPPEKEDHLRLSEQGHGNKNHETCDLIDFLLNHYYHTPKYPSICLEPSHPTSTCQWQRSVHATGNGFQINLRKYKCDSTSQMQNLHTQGPVQNPQNRAEVYYAKGCSKEFKNQPKDTTSEADDQLTPADGKGHLLEKTHAYQVKDSKSGSQSQFSSPKRSAELELADFLEEISSDSECFNETLIINKEEEEKSVAIYENASERGSLDAEAITNIQEIRSSQPTLYSKCKHFEEEKHSKYQFRKQVKRFKYERRCSWLEGENNFMRVENSNRKRKKRLGPKYMFGQGNYRKSSSGYLRKRRWFRYNTFYQRVNYRLFRAPTTSSKFTNAFYSRRFPQRRQTIWKTRYNQNVRRFTRHENSTHFRPTSDNYNIRYNTQEYSGYRSYLQNN
ncbi:A-kinase anchor protein 17B [Myotis brandtii]|uniref:A-kinase anchor protein 17B n=1 Tax=Myotis brandtii TaxID=109478 RepID=S7P0S0_MYOBR|nr:A-kinase anchor protein 17B [Myotis brandtii]